MKSQAKYISSYSPLNKIVKTPTPPHLVPHRRPHLHLVHEIVCVLQEPR